MDATNYLPDTLKKLARMAGRNVAMQQDQPPEPGMDQFAGGGKPMGNQPIPDMDNGGVSPFSLDARANQVIVPPPQQQSMMGNWADQVSQPPDNFVSRAISSPFKNLANGLMDEGRQIYDAIPSMPSFEERGKGVLGALKKIGQLAARQGPTTTGVPFEAPTPYSAIPKNNPIPPQSGMEEPLQTQEMQQPMQPQESFPQSEIYSPYTENDEMMNSPEVQVAFKEYAGMPLTPEMQEEITAYQKIIQDMDKSLQEIEGEYDDQLMDIRSRIDAGAATDMDKYLIGAALLMPAIIGAAFGKDAGIGALGGGLTGLAKGMENRSKGQAENRDILKDLTMQKGKFALERGELDLKKGEIPKSVKDQLKGEEHLKGKKHATWTDAEGKKMEGFEMKPNLIAPMSMVNDKDDWKDMLKNANPHRVAFVDQIASTGKDLVELMDAVEKAEPGAPSRILSAMTYDTKTGKILINASANPVKFKGKMVNPVIMAKQIVGSAQDKYLKARGIRRTEGNATHGEDLLVDYYKSGASAKDVQDATLGLIDLAQKDAVTSATSKGFEEFPLTKHFKKIRENLLGMMDKSQQEREFNKVIKEL
jgi:hypothetical protein